MIRLIGLEGTLTQTRTGVGSVTFPSKRPTRGQYGVLMENSEVFICIILSVVIS